MLNKSTLIIAALLFTTLISCKKDDKPEDNMMTFTATLSGANEVPSNTSVASGNATLMYNKSTKAFSVTTTYTGLTPTGGHIHKAASGTNGPVIFPFASLASPIKLEGSLTDAQALALTKDSMYVNLHTTDFPGGEIRGQLKKQ